jgi:pimeloyl-ACP methyl ester carboxylesterase
MTSVETPPVQARDTRLAVGRGTEIAATVYTGDVEPRALVWCVPGGGVDRRYWDVPVEGAVGDYSFPHRAVPRGYFVVTADHLGTGDSSRPATVDADDAVDAMSRALAAVRRDLRVEHLPSVGVGHSMGSGLTLHQQDRFHDHAGLVITGWSNIALTLPADDGNFYPLGTAGVKSDMRRHNHGEGVTAELKAANVAIRTQMPEPALGWVIEASRLADAARRVDVPVLLAHGKEDVTPDPAADAALYERAPSVETIVLPRSHHWHSGSPDRHVLWDAMVSWLDARFGTAAAPR